MILPRGSSSGPFLVEPVKGLRNWDLLSPVSFVLMPAGHVPGLYMCSASEFLRVAGSAGNVGYALSFDQRDVGPAVFTIGTANINVAPGLISTTNRNLDSSGAAPIIATFTPNSVGGSPRMNLAVNAVLLGLSSV